MRSRVRCRMVGHGLAVRCSTTVLRGHVAHALIRVSSDGMNGRPRCKIRGSFHGQSRRAQDGVLTTRLDRSATQNGLAQPTERGEPATSRCSSARSSTGASDSTTAWDRRSCSRPTARSSAGKRLQDPTITAVAERLDRTPAQVMLRWAIQHQAVVIPKSSRKEPIFSNAELFDFELADSNMRTLDALDHTNSSPRARR